MPTSDFFRMISRVVFVDYADNYAQYISFIIYTEVPRSKTDARLFFDKLFHLAIQAKVNK